MVLIILPGEACATTDTERQAILSDLDGLMMRLSRAFRDPFAGVLTPTQFMLLGRLRHSGELGMGEVAEGLGITMAGATGLVDRLVQAGLVARVRSASDRRRVLIALTDQGRSTLEMARAQRRERFHKITEGLSDDDLAQLRRLIGLMLKEASD